MSAFFQKAKTKLSLQYVLISLIIGGVVSTVVMFASLSSENSFFVKWLIRLIAMGIFGGVLYHIVSIPQFIINEENIVKKVRGKVTRAVPKNSFNSFQFYVEGTALFSKGKVHKILLKGRPFLIFPFEFYTNTSDIINALESGKKFEPYERVIRTFSLPSLIYLYRIPTSFTAVMLTVIAGFVVFVLIKISQTHSLLNLHPYAFLGIGFVLLILVKAWQQIIGYAELDEDNLCHHNPMFLIKSKIPIRSIKEIALGEVDLPQGMTKRKMYLVMKNNQVLHLPCQLNSLKDLKRLMREVKKVNRPSQF